jgi:hypothetical protein
LPTGHLLSDGLAGKAEELAHVSSFQNRLCRFAQFGHPFQAAQPCLVQLLLHDVREVFVGVELLFSG